MIPETDFYPLAGSKMIERSRCANPDPAGFSAFRRNTPRPRSLSSIAIVTTSNSMAAQIGIPGDASTEQLHIIIGALYLSLAHAMEHISAAENLSSAVAFRDQLLTGLKSGDIDMSLLDDAKTFDLVIAIVENALKLKADSTT
jgi:hypothetical protein